MSTAFHYCISSLHIFSAYLHCSHLGVIFGRLGRSWKVLWGCWGVLGSLLGGLGGLLGGLGNILGSLRPAWVHFSRFELNKPGRPGHVGPIWELQMAPKRHPKRTKIEDKNEYEKRNFSRSPRGSLGTILERYWDPSWIKKMCVFVIFCHEF